MRLQRFNVERVEEDPKAIADLIAQGFTPLDEVQEKAAESEDQKEPESPGRSLADFTKDELVELARQNEIKGAKNLTKGELFEILFGKESEDDD